jgi:Lhr-like helicase
MYLPIFEEGLEMADEYITLTQAREILGVSKVKIARMVRDGDLVTIPDKRDARVKLVKKSDVEQLAESPTYARDDDDVKSIPGQAA